MKKEKTKKENILIIDDDEEIIFLIRDFLKNIDVNIIESSNINSAYSKCINNRPALILLDIDLGGDNGFKFFELLNQQKSLREIPVVLMSGCKDPEIIRKSKLMGGKDYLLKPFTDELLIRKVLKNINKGNLVKYKFPQTKKYAADFEVGIKISKIAETGIIVTSPIKLQVKKDIHINANLLEKLECEKLNYKVMSNVLSTPTGFFKFFISFLGVNDSIGKIIRKNVMIWK